MKIITAAICSAGMLWFHRRKSSSNGKGGKGNSALSIATGNDTLDTVTMARIERENNGPWEVECSYGGEADLHEHLKSCEKNPGHVNFIPVDQFNVEHLPPGYKDDDLVDLVKAISDLTVRVSVEYVSDKRPNTFPGSDMPYPCYKKRGSNLMRVGSGLVTAVRKLTNKDKMCDCKENLNPEKPETNFAHIEIRTAAHVVYDKLEGADTTCHLFFDGGVKPDRCGGVVALSGMTRVEIDPEIDRCHMTYETYDPVIIDKLNNAVVRRETLQGKIRKKYNIGFYQVGAPTIIVSHPHGCSKQVSVGNIHVSDLNIWPVAQNYGLSYKNNLLYNTATCPGSSGACVLEFNRYNFSLSCSHHSGNLEKGRKVNFSKTPSELYLILNLDSYLEKLISLRWDLFFQAPFPPPPDA